MRSIMTGRNGLWALVIASLAFNLGFGTTFGVRTYRHACTGKTGECKVGQALLASLNLTPEQQEQFAVARQRLLEQVQELRRQLTPEHEKLVDLLAAPAPDHAAIASQLDAIANLQRRIQQQVAEHLLEERSLLSPEQETNFNQFIRTSLCPLGFNAAQGLSGCREPGCGSGHGPCGHGAGNKP